MGLDFLNSREEALALWVLLILGYLVRKDARGMGGSFWELLLAFFRLKLVLLYGLALGYAAALVYTAKWAGLWHTGALKATTYWFVGTAVILVANAVEHGWRRDPEFLGRILRRVAGFTLFIEFAVNLYALPLVAEFIGIGLAITGGMMLAYLDHFPTDASTSDPRFRKVLGGMLTAVGLVYLGYFVVRGVGDLRDASIHRDRWEEFLVGPVLTLALIPFLYAVAWVTGRERRRTWRTLAVPPERPSR